MLYAETYLLYLWLDGEQVILSEGMLFALFIIQILIIFSAWLASIAGLIIQNRRWNALYYLLLAGIFIINAGCFYQGAFNGGWFLMP